MRSPRLNRPAAIVPLLLAALLAGAAIFAPGSDAQGERDSKRAGGKLLTGTYQGGGFGRHAQYVSVKLGSTRKRATQTLTLTASCSRLGRTTVDSLTVRRMIVRGGRAKFEAPFRETIRPEVPGVGSLLRTGVVSGTVRFDRSGNAAGVVRTRFNLTDPTTRRAVARCDSGRTAWRARRTGSRPGTVERGRPAPARRSTYVGTTSGRRPFLLETDARGRSVSRAGMSFDASCPSTLGQPLEITTGPMAIRAKGARRGRFGRSGRFVRTFVDSRLGSVREVYRWRLAGRFGPRTVGGRWTVSADVLDAETGERLDDCAVRGDRFRAAR